LSGKDKQGETMKQNPLEYLVQKYPDLEPHIPEIISGFEMLKRCFEGGGKLLLCGNGGGAADCEHIVGELMKVFRNPRPVPEPVRRALVENFPDQGDFLADHLHGALPAISLVSQVGLISAIANDTDASMIFAQQVYGYGRPGDVVWGLSTSGKSTNVLNALRVARSLGLSTLSMTASGGGLLPDVSDVVIRVPWQDTGDAQERHIAIYHTICTMLEQTFFCA
jgi:phosphoheptose isomerase